MDILEYLPIIGYLGTIGFAIWVARRLRMPFLSPYGIFLLFQSLYNVTPWMMERLDFTPALFGLLSERSLLQAQLICSSLANVCFSTVYLFRWKRVVFYNAAMRGTWASRRSYLYAAFPLFAVTCVLTHLYGWHQYTAAGYEAVGTESLGGMFTVTAYFKFLFVAVYLYYIYRFGLDKGAWILMAEHVVVLIFDGSRATFLPIVLLTLFIFADQQSDRRVLRRAYMLAVVGIAASIGVRSLIIVGDSLPLKLLTPITIEGAMGDYPALQSLAGIEHAPSPNFTIGASYVIDPLVWIVPQGSGREAMLSFNKWIKSIDSAYQSRYAPMGGFYYLAEAFAAFSYAGPVLVTGIFACSLVWFETNKTRFRFMYLAWMPTIGLLFIKTQFGNVFKLFVIQLTCMSLLFVCGRLKARLFSNYCSTSEMHA